MPPEHCLCVVDALLDVLYGKARTPMPPEHCLCVVEAGRLRYALAQIAVIH